MNLHQHVAVEQAALDALLEAYGDIIRNPRCITDEGWMRYNVANMLFVMQKARVDALKGLFMGARP